MTIDHSTFDVDPTVDRAGFLVARNSAVTSARLARIAHGYANATTDDPQIAEWVTRWRDSPTSAPWLYLYGAVGTGKTWAVVAAIREAVKVPRTVAWELVTFSALLESRRPGTQQVDGCRYEKADLLVVDDLGMVKSSSEWAIEELWRVVDYRRRNQLATVLTGNVPPAGLSAEFNEQIVSRIAQSCIVVAMAGTDRRRMPRPDPPPVAPPAPAATTDHSSEIRAFALDQIRSVLPEGDPDALRHATREWNRFRRWRGLKEEPNPHYWARQPGRKPPMPPAEEGP